MYAKSFIAISTTGRLTSARSALSKFNHQYECHLCGCPVELHNAGTGRAPWFEHIERPISTRRRNDCPYFNPEQEEIDRVMTLRRLVPGPFHWSGRQTGTAQNARLTTMGRNTVDPARPVFTVSNTSQTSF